MHRFVALLGLVAALCWSSVADAQRSVTVSRSFDIPTGGGAVDFFVHCPIGYRYAGSEVTYLGNKPTEASVAVVGINGQVPDFTLGSTTLEGPTGVRVRARNDRLIVVEGVVTLTCVTDVFFRASAGLHNQATIPPHGTGSVAGFCPAGETAVGQASNADGVSLVTRFVVLLYGTPPAVTLMDDLPPGTHPGPSGIGRSVANNTAAPLTLHALTLCAPLPGAQTTIFSTPTTPGDRFSIFAPVPDDREHVFNAFVGGLYGDIALADTWGRDGTVASHLIYGSEAILQYVNKARMIEGVDTRHKSFAPKASARAVIGMVTIPATAAPPPPTIVTVVEFYHAGLDHYFITAIAKEIGDLDSGVHPGWQRTGQTFKAYGPGSSGRTGRRPVCRAYGNPARGLDSHFYSASTQECLATLANFNGAWLLEASEVFEMDLPDTTTGACPAGGVAIHRLWNNRSDSNHRYVNSTVLRDQLIAQRWIAEGYGPNAVALCALP